MSPDEITKANKFKFTLNRQHFIFYRSALRKILGIYCNINPEDLKFSYTKYGKPYLKENIGHSINILQFNLSHSADIAVFGVTKNHLLGIDIEQIKPLKDMDNIAKQFFAKSEYEKFSAIANNYKTECFYEIWTRKESFIKAIGRGISYPLDRFEVTFYNDLPPRLIHINDSIQEAKKWKLLSSSIIQKNKQYTIACLVQNVQNEFIEFKNAYDKLLTA